MPSDSTKWYSSVTRYQWLVLVVASLGWIFDAFEGQIYNLTRADMLPDLLHVKADDPLVKLWGERFLGIFLIGGTFGGLLFSSLADKWGRNPVMALTILFYSVFSGITAFAHEIWQVGALRFLVAMGVGLWVGTQWRTAYLLGVAPALLVLWVRMSIKEPESWKAARESKTKRMGSFTELLGDSRWRSRAVFGAMLAMVGLATFWGVVVAGQDIAADFLKRANDPDWASKSKIAFGFIQTAGAGAGMIAFGPLAARWGCKKTFVIMHIAALIMTPIVCWLPSQMNSYTMLLVLLPIFGFFAQGIHAGYAAYFPALFPTHLRATGSGFCFNTGRLLAAPVLIWLSASMKATMDLRVAVSCLGGFFLLGLVFLALLPETHGEELPE